MFSRFSFTGIARTATRAFSTTPRSQLARMQIIGRLGAAPEEVDTSTGRTMIRYSLASDYGPPDNRQTSWFRIAAFLEDGPRKNHLLGIPKGTLVHLDADAQMGAFENDEGQKIPRLNLIHRQIEVLSRPRVSGEESVQSEAQPAAAAAA